MFQRHSWILVVVAALACSCSDPEADLGDARKLDTPEAYREFLEDHPDSPQAEEARRRLDELVAAELLRSRSPEQIEAYVEAHPGSPQLPQLLHRLAELDLEAARGKGTHAAFEAFIEAHPDSSLRRAAIQEIIDLVTKAPAIHEPLRVRTIVQMPEGKTATRTGLTSFNLPEGTTLVITLTHEASAVEAKIRAELREKHGQVTRFRTVDGGNLLVTGGMSVSHCFRSSYIPPMPPEKITEAGDVLRLDRLISYLAMEHRLDRIEKLPPDDLRKALPGMAVLQTPRCEEILRELSGSEDGELGAAARVALESWRALDARIDR